MRARGVGTPLDGVEVRRVAAAPVCVRKAPPGSAGVSPAPYSCKQPAIHGRSPAKRTQSAFTGISSIVPGLVRAGRPRSQEDLSMGLRLRPSAAAAWRLHSNPGWMPGDNLLENPIPRQARAPSTGSNTPPPRAPTATIRSTTAPRPCKPSWSNCSPKPTRNPPMRSFSTSTPPTIPSTGSKRTASSRYGYY